MSTNISKTCESDAKKELGQHWLTDEAILQAIVDAAEIKDTDTVLEIGPGLGTLTSVLAGSCAQVIALEYDAQLIPMLRKKFRSQDSTVRILEGDIRRFDYSLLPKDYKVVSNIPYYLTSNLIRGLSETSNPPTIAALLVQKEVAERICARPGQMSILSVVAQLYFHCAKDIIVTANYFQPPPKVDSQVVVLQRHATPLFDIDVSLYLRIVKAGFSERRKTLRNTLSAGLHLTKDEIEKVLNEAKISPNSRAQELDLQQWYTLYVLLNPVVNNI